MLAALLSHSAGVILNRAILGVLNAQLIAVSNCKASWQFHSYHSCLGDVHRLIVLNDLCILGIAIQFNAVSRSSSRSYNTVLRSDLQRQRFVCRVIRGRLNLQSRLNVQLLVRSITSYLVCIFNQFIRLAFVDLLCFINSSRAEGRCGNSCCCCLNGFLIFLRNLVYLNFRSSNRRLDLNIAGFGLCNYLVAVTGYITGSGNVAGCNVCAGVGGEVTAGDNRFCACICSSRGNAPIGNIHLTAGNLQSGNLPYGNSRVKSNVHHDFAGEFSSTAELSHTSGIFFFFFSPSVSVRP